MPAYSVVCSQVGAYLPTVSSLAVECCQLQSINLAGCDKLINAGVSALGTVCGQLLIVNLACYDKVTDAHVSHAHRSFVGGIYHVSFDRFLDGNDHLSEEMIYR